MVDDKRNETTPNNLTELDPERVREQNIDPLTDTRTVAQTPTDDGDIVPLPETEDGVRTGDFDHTTGAAHPSADSGADRGNEELNRRLEGRRDQSER